MLSLPLRTKPRRRGFCFDVARVQPLNNEAERSGFKTSKALQILVIVLSLDEEGILEKARLLQEALVNGERHMIRSDFHFDSLVA